MQFRDDFRKNEPIPAAALQQLAGRNGYTGWREVISLMRLAAISRDGFARILMLCGVFVLAIGIGLVTPAAQAKVEGRDQMHTAENSEGQATIDSRQAEIAAISEIKVLPGQDTAVQKAVADVRAMTLEDPGCLEFYASAKENDPSTIVLFEVFRSQTAFSRHGDAPATKQFLAALKGKVEGGAPFVTLLQRTASAQHMAASSDPARPRGIDHVGLTVPDVDAASLFFEQAFGARPIYDVQPKGTKPMEGQATERELGLPHGAKIVHMRLLRIGNGPSLELFRIDDALQHHAAALNDFGWTHVALYVDDIEQASKRFVEAGGTLLSDPHPLAGVEAGPANRGAYGRAPWGGLIELLTYPSGIKYPTPAVRRWTPAS